MNRWNTVRVVYYDYLIHYNHNHDPSNGQFTTSGGGGVRYAGSEKEARKQAKEQAKKEKQEAEAQKRVAKAEANYKKKNSEDYSNKSEAARFALNIVRDVATMNPVALAYDVTRAGEAAVSAIKSAKYKAEKKNAAVDSKTGFKLKSKDLDEKADLSRVNPSFRNFDSNTKSNCMLCTSTYDLRRRGYDVTAKTAGAGFFTTDINKWYPKAKVKNISGEDPKLKSNNQFIGSRTKIKDATDKFIKEAQSQGEGARGNIMVTWNGTASGHSMVYEVKGGKVRILDAQANKVYNDPYKILKQTTGTFDVARLDNVDFNIKEIKRCCG